MHRRLQRGRRFLPALGIAVLGAAPLGATDLESSAEKRKDVSLTIYNQDLCLIREQRSIPTGSGVFRLRYADVTSGIDPTTVHLQPLGSGKLEILEQNYEFDLISRDKLMEKYVGRDVGYRTGDGTIGKARLLAVNQGPVYQLGEKVVFDLPGPVVLDAVPQELAARPTLVWALDGGKAGERDVEVTYLSHGFNWHADYVLLLDESEKKGGLTGWVTIDNTSGGTFQNAQLKLVAGDVRRVTPVLMKEARMEMATDGGRPQFTEEGLFEYHLYTLQRRTDLKDNQQKQILFFDAGGVQIAKHYQLRSGGFVQPMRIAPPRESGRVEVSLKIQNTSKNSLGMPIPQGVVRVYKRDRDGAAQFLGEDRVQHTPKDETLELTVGSAFDIVSRRAQTDFKRLAESAYEAAFSIELSNHKDEAIDVDVEEGLAGDWNILESSLPYTKKDASTAAFTVPVPANGKTTLTYRVRVQP